MKSATSAADIEWVFILVLLESSANVMARRAGSQTHPGNRRIMAIVTDIA